MDYVVTDFTTAFGGFIVDDNTYTHPTEVPDWAGASWSEKDANDFNIIKYPSFENGGRITFNYKNNSESAINLRFFLDQNGRTFVYYFECLPGSDLAEIIIPQLGVQEITNIHLNIEERDLSIILTDFKIYESVIIN